MQGLYHRRETEIENVLEASERIIQYDERSKTKRRNKQDNLYKMSEEFIEKNIEEQKEMDSDENQKYDEFARINKDEQPISHSIKKKEMKDYNKSKINREIKPGYDMYNYIAFSQFLIMVYTILFFTLVERDYSNRAPENYTLQQFSGSTVLVVFAMILVI